MSIQKVKYWPRKDLSHLGKLWFDDGMLGFNLIVEGDKYTVGDKLLFYPCMSIDKFSISDTNKRFLKSEIFNIYEFTFKAIAKYPSNLKPSGYYNKFKDINHYMLEILPGFNVFHFNWTKSHKDYLKIGTLYRAYGRLSNCDNPATANPNIDAVAIKRMRCIGELEKIQPNLIMKDFSRNNTDIKQNKIRKSMTDKDETISYEDALENMGYFEEDELKFKVNVSNYKNKSPNLRSTDENKDNDMLLYYFKMM